MKHAIVLLVITQLTDQHAVGEGKCSKTEAGLRGSFVFVRGGLGFIWGTMWQDTVGAWFCSAAGSSKGGQGVGGAARTA